MPKYLEGKIIKINDIGEATKRFLVEVEGVEKVDFRAGQFVTMELPIHEKRLRRMRSYSIANAPNGGNVLEFCIVKLEGGAAGKYLFEETKIGTSLKFKPPAGVFTLPTEIQHQLVFVCTGTGVAPFRSMIHDIYQKNIPHKGLHLIFGTRYEKGILYRNEFEKLAQQYPDFQYDIALSRQKDWQGWHGYVHQVYEKLYSDVIPERRFYLCGWSRMIDDAVARLKAMGYEEKQIRYELYG